MGNIRYMSRSSHKWLERSRKDDLESWLYMIVEFFLTTSSLPWEDERNHATVLKKKEAFMNNGKIKYQYLISSATSEESHFGLSLVMLYVILRVK